MVRATAITPEPVAGRAGTASTTALVGWFGPRGLASVVFALLALEELGSRTAGSAVAVITVTVLLSVLVHGATADPLATRYARLLTRQADGHIGAGEHGIPERRLIRRAASTHAAAGGAGPSRPDSPAGG